MNYTLILVDVYVETFGKIEEVNMVTTSVLNITAMFFFFCFLFEHDFADKRHIDTIADAIKMQFLSKSDAVLFSEHSR